MEKLLTGLVLLYVIYNNNKLVLLPLLQDNVGWVSQHYIQ